MNKVILMGRLTADPELRHAPSGTIWTSFNIAVDRRGAKEGQQTADFIPCTAFNKTAEFIAKYFTKGKMIALEGSLHSRTYDDNGKSRTGYDVVVYQAYFTGDRGNEGYQPMPSYDVENKQTPQSKQERIDFNNPGSGFIDLDDDANEDDLPF